MIFDIGLTDDILINNKLDAAIQELDILFNTIFFNNNTF